MSVFRGAEERGICLSPQENQLRRSVSAAILERRSLNSSSNRLVLLSLSIAPLKRLIFDHLLCPAMCGVAT